MKDKTKRQIMRIIKLLILTQEKRDKCQKKDILQVDGAELQKLYNILSEKYSNKVVLLEKLQQLIQFCQKAVVDEASNMKYLQLLEDTLACVESEQFDKIKVLFLPYKASMWDSMESIYLAAKKSADCHVDVMPIPYYNINKQREIISMEYEGNLFPDELGIIDYRVYDLADERPDVVFIHNPYDQYNFVTQIHPDYFSENLKQYTDHLCYTPYDIAIESTFNEDLCRMPGIQNAWRVFVQSETLKERYEKYNHKDKVVCLGSPKIDSVVNGLRCKENLPQEWLEKTEGKKVFMLNIHLSRVIVADDLDLQFFENLISYMKANLDIAVIWRPHPLIFQTIKSMNPTILEAFQEIVDEFKELPNAIYDDTADMHMAIELSDAYFGDGGSLLTIYGATGKPMYLCNEPRVDFEFDSSFSTTRMSPDGRWAFCNGHNGLYSIDYMAKEIHYEFAIPSQSLYAKQLYMDIVEYNNWLYMLPYNAKDIIAVDKTTHEVVIIESSIGSRKYKYTSKIVHENNLIITPACSTDTLIIVDMDTQTAEELYLEKIHNRSQKDELTYAIAALKDGAVYIPSRNRNEVLVYSESKRYWQCVENLEDGLWECLADETHLWILPKQGAYVYRCTLDFKEIKKIDYADALTNVKILYNDNKLFIRIVDAESHILLIPMAAEFFLRISKDTLAYDKVDISARVMKEVLLNGKSYFGEPFYKEGKLYLLSVSVPMLVTVDVSSKTIKIDDFVVHNGEIETLNSKNKQLNTFETMNKVIYNSSECSFEYFSKIVDKESSNMRENRKKHLLNGVKNIDGTVGEKIWNYLYTELKV